VPVLTPPSPFARSSQDRDSAKGGGNYRVLLMDSPQHTEKLVVQAITRTIPGADDTHARNCFVSRAAHDALHSMALRSASSSPRQQQLRRCVLYVVRVRKTGRALPTSAQFLPRSTRPSSSAWR
jgi:hypothetical protein